MRLLYFDLRLSRHGGNCPASAPHGYGSLTQHVMIIVLLDLPKYSALIQVFRWPRHSLYLFLLKLLTALNVYRDEVG